MRMNTRTRSRSESNGPAMWRHPWWGEGRQRVIYGSGAGNAERRRRPAHVSPGPGTGRPYRVAVQVQNPPQSGQWRRGVVRA